MCFEEYFKKLDSSPTPPPKKNRILGSFRGEQIPLFGSIFCELRKNVVPTNEE